MTEVAADRFRSSPRGAEEQRVAMHTLPTTDPLPGRAARVLYLVKPASRLCSTDEYLVPGWR
jgi:hypothetical protein